MRATELLSTSAFRIARASILAASGSAHFESFARNSRAARHLVSRYIAGETSAEVIAQAERLQMQGLLVTMDLLGEDVADEAGVSHNVAAYVELVSQLRSASIADADLSVKPSALGLRLSLDLAKANLARVAAAAEAHHVTLTLDMEGSDLTDATLSLFRELRLAHPQVGIVVQAMLRRTEEDCAALAVHGSRVRLCKGAYAEASGVAYTTRQDVRAAYIRCLDLLMAGSGYPMVATHDTELLDAATQLANKHRRAKSEWEYQMLFGVRAHKQQALAKASHRVRVYLPFGSSWYPYVMRRLAERPSNLALFLRSTVSSN